MENCPITLVKKLFKEQYPEVVFPYIYYHEFKENKEDGENWILGQCSSMENGNKIIFIEPRQSIVETAYTLAHELIHVVVGMEAGHNGPNFHGEDFETEFKDFEEIYLDALENFPTAPEALFDDEGYLLKCKWELDEENKTHEM